MTRLTRAAGLALGLVAFDGSVCVLGATPTSLPAALRARASAQATIESLRTDARALRSGTQRAEVANRLCALPLDALPAIRQRVRELTLRRTGDAGYAALIEIGEAASAMGPNDPRDLLPGILAFPAERTRPVHASVIEKYCLLRSLEAMGTAEALVVAGPLLTTDMRALRWQARHLVRRAGRRATAMVIRAASHTDPEVELWSSWALQHLGIRDSGDAVQNQTEDALIAVLRAYAEIRHLGGMPVVASFVDDPRVTVRHAARESLALYGDNATWELRRQHSTRLGRDPGAKPPAVLLRDLSRELDARREAPLLGRARRALEHERAGRHAEAAAEADALLAIAPVSDAARSLAPLFGARADRARESGDLDGARSLAERGLRLAATATRGLHEARVASLEEDARARAGLSFDVPDDAANLLGGTARAVHRRRALAFYGFVLAALVLSGEALAFALLRIGRTLRARSLEGSRALRSWYANGGRDRAIARSRAVSEAWTARSKLALETFRRAPVTWLRQLDELRARVDAYRSSRAARTTEPAVVTASAATPSPDRARATAERASPVEAPRARTPARHVERTSGIDHAPLRGPAPGSGARTGTSKARNAAPVSRPLVPAVVPAAPTPTGRRPRPTRKEQSEPWLLTTQPAPRKNNAPQR